LSFGSLEGSSGPGEQSNQDPRGASLGERSNQEGAV
jgi:hypothetical protein